MLCFSEIWSNFNKLKTPDQRLRTYLQCSELYIGTKFCFSKCNIQSCMQRCFVVCNQTDCVHSLQFCIAASFGLSRNFDRS